METRSDRRQSFAAAPRGALRAIMHVTTTQWAAALRAEGAVKRARSIETAAICVMGGRGQQTAVSPACVEAPAREPAP